VKTRTHEKLTGPMALQHTSAAMTKPDPSASEHASSSGATHRYEEQRHDELERMHQKVKKLRRKVKHLARKLALVEKVVNCSIAHF
jgi:hypothetical protein